MDPITRLGEVVATAGEFHCLCDIQGGAQKLQIRLHARNAEKKVEASFCYLVDDKWQSEFETVTTVTEGLAALAKRCPGEVLPESLHTESKKTVLRGEALRALCRAALFQAFEGRVPEDAQTAYEALAFTEVPVRTVVRKKATPTIAPEPPEGLAQVVSSEPLQLAKLRASLHKKWSLKRTETLQQILSLVAQLIAFGREDEALEVASAMVEGMPPEVFARDKFLFSLACKAAAVVAHIKNKREDKSGIKAMQAMLLKDSFEVSDPSWIKWNVIQIWLHAFNGRYYQPAGQAYGVAMLSEALIQTLLREQLAAIEPYRSLYSAQNLVPIREEIAKHLKFRVVTRNVTAPKGFSPLKSVDPVYSLAFESDGTMHAEEKEFRCRHCKAALRLAKCVVCPSWFVRDGSMEKSFACPAHTNSDTAMAAGGRISLTDGQRACRACKKEAVPLGI